MTTRKPDDPATLSDPRVDAAWRAASREEPPTAIDAAILAAARREVGAGPQSERAREAMRARRHWWPLAAVATIGVLAVGVLQLSTPDQFGTNLPGDSVVTDMPAPVARPAPERTAAASREDTAKDSAKGERPALRAEAPPAPALTERQESGVMRDDPPSRKIAAAPDPFPAASSRDSTPPVASEKPATAPASVAGRAAAEQRRPVRPPHPANEAFAERAPLPRAPAASGSAASAPASTIASEPVAAQPPDSPPGAVRRPAPMASPPTAATAVPGSVADAPARGMADDAATRRAAVAKTAAGSVADDGRGDARARERAPLSNAEWIALIRKLRAEGKIEDAAKELAAFRAAHVDHERLLPPDLRDWQPAGK